jgi:hypothetical protein
MGFYCLVGVKQLSQFLIISKRGILTWRFSGDGDRLYYDGCSMIIVNGKIVAQASQSVPLRQGLTGNSDSLTM